jgi:threonine dehydrogenase-like Zn-dependent dehydrogenase
MDLALRSTRANGRVLVGGIPSGGADLTPLWFRELELVGAYTATGEDFAAAIGAAANLPILDQLVGATYVLDDWRDAIDHAMSAGSLGTFKVAFRPQD